MEFPMWPRCYTHALQHDIRPELLNEQQSKKYYSASVNRRCSLLFQTKGATKHLGFPPDYLSIIDDLLIFKEN